MKKYVILIILIFTVLISCEKDKDNQKPFVVSDLNNYLVSAMLVDYNDVLWVGTDSGLFKQVTDGFQLVDTKLDAPVTALSVDSENRTLWVGTKGGLSRLTIGNTNLALPVDNKYLSNSSINAVHVDQNAKKWIGTDTGLTAFDNIIWQKEKFKKNLSGTITPLDFESIKVNSIASWDGDYYFATNGLQLWRTWGWNATADAFTGATQFDSPYNGTAISDTMFVVFVDSKSQIWMGGTTGLQVHVGHDSHQENTSFFDEIVDLRVHCIAEAPDGKIWVGTENGISIYDGATWTAYSGLLPDSFITAICIKSDGQVWVGSKKGATYL
jgi:ligand-binding sensor domain-containing protein